MLKFRFKTLEEIPEALRAHYKQESGGDYVLQAEGAVDATRLVEFRENNITLKKQLDALGNITAEDLGALRQFKADVEAGKLKGTKAEELLEQRTAEMKKTFEGQLTTLTQERDAGRNELSRLKISDAAISAGMKLGLRGSAKDDLAMRVGQVFKLDKDGTPKAYDASGAVIYGADAQPMTVDNYVAGLVKTADHLFDPSSGTNSGGGHQGGGGAGHTGANPFKKETWNLTQQSVLLKKDRAQAIALAKQAGVTLPGA